VALDNNSVKVIDVVEKQKNIDISFSTSTINSFNRKVTNPKEMIGYYMALTNLYLSDIGREDIETDVFFNENKARENPVYILFNRGTLSPANLAVPGSSFNPVGTENISVHINSGENINPNESLLGVHMLNAQMQIKLYAHNRVELEELGYKIYNLVLSVSDNILSQMFSDISRVMEPSMSSIIPTKDYDDMYECEIDWSIYYIESNILLFKEKMLKYNNFIVFDQQAQDEIKINKKG